jgi:ABC-type sugar transport system ATPase subunit
MTVADNMAFSLKLRKADPKMIEERVQKASKILNLDPYLKRYPRELSGGQRQRVAMGRAIVRDPKVFLFDEPLSNLDAKLRVAMRAEIKALHQRLKTTTVYVTHDQVEAMTMADRIVVMHDGRIEQIGTPLELYDHPSNLFVAQFIGSPAMNVVEGTVRRSAGSAYVEAPAASAGRCRKARRRRAGGFLRHSPEHMTLARNGSGCAWRGGRRRADRRGDRARHPGGRSAHRHADSRTADGQPRRQGDAHHRPAQCPRVRQNDGTAAEELIGRFACRPSGSLDLDRPVMFGCSVQM